MITIGKLTGKWTEIRQLAAERERAREGEREEVRRQRNNEFRKAVAQKRQSLRRQGLKKGDPCLGKRTFKSEGAARASIRSLLKRGLAKDERRIREYWCIRHNGYHVGHATEKADV